MKLQQKQSIFTVNVAHLILYINSNQYSCTFAEAYRTPEQAEMNVKKGTGIKDSLHCKRLAVDLNLFDSTDKYVIDGSGYEIFGRYWKSLHPLNRWGGDFKSLKDFNHFEMQDL